jgi:hypothetical protein
MPKYKMKNGQKRQQFCGGITRIINNGSKASGIRDFVFEPGEIVDTGDFNLNCWVRDGYLIEVKDEVKDEIKDECLDEDLDKKLDIIENISLESDSIDNFSIVDSNIEENDKIDGDDEDNCDKEDNKEFNNSDDINNEVGDYVSVKGGFRCLSCGKFLKSEKRMITHVDRKHKGLKLY